MNLKNWMEVANYKITEGSEFGWSCYGSSAYVLDSWNGEHDGYAMSIVFDKETQEVYEVSVCDYTIGKEAAYRLMNPNYIQAYKEEAQTHTVDMSEAWDGVKWIELEMFEDWVVKATAIRDGVEYDKRISVPIDLTDEEFKFLATIAHENDLSLNMMVEKILREEIERMSVVNENMIDT